MIPRVAQLGISFTGAGAYYLHDVREHKDEPIRDRQQIPPSDYYLHDKGRQSAGRVAYTETLNLPTRDPEKAMKVMAWTACHAGDIRQTAVAAAARACGMPYDEYVRINNPFRGRKGSKCVYAYSLAWSPDQDAPSQQEMAAAAKKTLKVLGMDNHQAVLVVHNDKPHPHIHVIVNRVHPKTGLYADYSRDRLKLSAWAEGYERATGRILCWERVENNRKRQNGAFVRHDPIPRADYEWWQQHKHMSPQSIHSARDFDQAQEKMLLLADIRHRDARLHQWAEKVLAPDIASLRAQIAKQEAFLANLKKPVGRKGLFQAVSHALRRAAMKVFGREKRARGLLPRLKASLKTVENRKEAEVKRLSEWQRRAHSALSARHKIEKQRDEERIKKLAQTNQARGQGDRSRSAFNARGDRRSAEHFRLSRADGEAFEKTFTARLDQRFYDQIRPHTALERMTKKMGVTAPTQARKGDRPLAQQKPKSPTVQKTKTAHSSDDRISKRLAENDREKKTRQRSRNRSRGRRRQRE